MNDPCYACEINQGNIKPEIKIENENAIGFLLEDHAVTQGHFLVVPREHYPQLHHIPANQFQDIFAIAQKYICHATGKLQSPPE